MVIVNSPWKKKDTGCEILDSKFQTLRVLEIHYLRFMIHYLRFTDSREFPLDNLWLLCNCFTLKVHLQLNSYHKERSLCLRKRFMKGP